MYGCKREGRLYKWSLGLVLAIFRFCFCGCTASVGWGDVFIPDLCRIPSVVAFLFIIFFYYCPSHSFLRSHQSRPSPALPASPVSIDHHTLSSSSGTKSFWAGVMEKWDYGLDHHTPFMQVTCCGCCMQSAYYYLPSCGVMLPPCLWPPPCPVWNVSVEQILLYSLFLFSGFCEILSLYVGMGHVCRVFCGAEVASCFHRPTDYRWSLNCAVIWAVWPDLDTYFKATWKPKARHSWRATKPRGRRLQLQNLLLF